jgi:hypothetical protein
VNDELLDRATAIASEMRLQTRYPYTYAYDWIKETICQELSRSEASRRITVACGHLKLTKEAVVWALAEEYIAYWSLIQAADELASKQKLTWKNKFENVT